MIVLCLGITYKFIATEIVVRTRSKFLRRERETRQGVLKDEVPSLSINTRRIDVHRGRCAEMFPNNIRVALPPLLPLRFFFHVCSPIPHRTAVVLP